MVKPRLLRNRPNPEGPGDGAEEEGGAVVVKERGGEGGEGKERAANDTPTPPPADPPSGIERAIQPETTRRRQIRSPRGQKGA